MRRRWSVMASCLLGRNASTAVAAHDSGHDHDHAHRHRRHARRACRHFRSCRASACACAGRAPTTPTPLFALFSDPAVMRYWSRPPMTTRAEAEGADRRNRSRPSRSARCSTGWSTTRAATTASSAPARCSASSRAIAAPRSAMRCARDHWGRGHRAAKRSRWCSTGPSARSACTGSRRTSIRATTGSRQLLARLGFASEGVLRERYFVGDEVSDTELFGLLAQRLALARRVQRCSARFSRAPSAPPPPAVPCLPGTPGTRRRRWRCSRPSSRCRTCRSPPACRRRRRSRTPSSGDRARQRFGALAEGVELEHADRAVPDHGAGLADHRRRSAAAVSGPMSRIMSSAPTSSTRLDRRRRIGGEARRDDDVGRHRDVGAARLRVAP